MHAARSGAGTRQRHSTSTILCALGLAAASPVALGAAAAPVYELSAHIPLGPGKRWDYITVDAAGHRAYLAHADKVEVADTATRSRVGTISGLQGTHGVAIAPALGRGFISDGKANAVVIFDLKTLAVVRTVPVGRNPDAIVFDARSGRVATFNGASHDATLLDAASGAVLVQSLPLGGKPEFAHVDAAGLAYLNIEDTAEVVVVDLAKGAVLKRYSIAPCEEPTGLALTADRHVVSVCKNHLAVVSDPASGRLVSQVTIGEGPDGVAADDGFAFSANGRDGTISVFAPAVAAAAASAPAATIASRRSARTIDVDPQDHALYLPALAAAPSADGKAPASEEIEILVFTRK